MQGDLLNKEVSKMFVLKKITIILVLVLVSFSYVVAAEMTFTPQRDYKGDMYVVIKTAGYVGYEECSEIKVIWGPWETEPVSAIKSARTKKPFAIKFKKKERDQIPLTVVTNCPASIELKHGNPDSRSYDVTEPRWRRR
jgi:hypothetical protein